MNIFKKENVKKYIPIIGAFSDYKSRYILMDIIAALTLVAITVPEAVAYAQMAGVPPEVGFYTIPLAMLGYAIFGSSRNVIMGPSSTVAVMSAAVIGSLAIKGADEFLAMTAALAIICGVVYLIFGIAKLGFISNFISKPVITGFVFGLALYITMRQLPKIIGVAGIEGNFFEVGVHIVKNLGDIQWWTFLIGASSIAILFILGKYVPRIPGAIVIVVYSIFMVTLLNLESKGVHIVGEIPAALPKFSIPDISFHDIVKLLPGAIGIVFIGYAETLGAARDYGAKNNYEINPNQELIALGIANLGSGLSSGFTVDASLSRSAANDNAGAKSQLSPIIATGLIIIVVLWFTPFFHNLAEAAIGAIIIHAIWHLMKVGELRRIYKIKKVDFWLSLLALLGVLIFGVLPGLVIAVVASMIAIIIKSSRLNTVILGKVPGRNVYTDIKRHPENETLKGIVALRPNSPLFYANINMLHEEIREILKKEKGKTKVVIIDMEMTSDIDSETMDTLDKIRKELKSRSIEMMLARVHGNILDLMKRSVLKEMIEEKRVFKTVREAVEESKKIKG